MTKEQKNKYNKTYRLKHRDELNQKRREKYLQNKLNKPVVDKPKQIRKKRKLKENKITKDIQEYRRQYRLKHKQTNNDYQREYRKKIKQEKPIKQKIEKVKPIKDKKYTISQQIEEQINESLKLGQITNELGIIMLKIANGISNRLKYSDMDLKYDCKAAGLESMLTQYHNYNHNNTNCNAFAYLSEICKRGMARQFNEFNYKKYGIKLNVIRFDYWK